MRASLVDIVYCKSLREKAGNYLENTCVYKGLHLKSIRNSINQAFFSTKQFFTARTHPKTDLQLSRPTPRKEFMGKLIDARKNLMIDKRSIFAAAFKLPEAKLQKK